MVLVDWKNTGTSPIRAVNADIVPKDTTGNTLQTGAKDYCIYATSNSSPGIAPGETYTEPDGEGFVLLTMPGVPGFTEAATAAVKITRVSRDSNL